MTWLCPGLPSLVEAHVQSSSQLRDLPVLPSSLSSYQILSFEELTSPPIPLVPLP